VGDQKAAVRANVEKLNVSLAEHGRMRDEAIISQYAATLIHKGAIWLEGIDLFC
jgi:hypothetical protein